MSGQFWSWILSLLWYSKLFLSATKQDFDGTSSSRFTAYANFTSAIGLFIILPILSERLHIHDALTIAVVQVSEYISNIIVIDLIFVHFRIKTYSFPSFLN